MPQPSVNAGAAAVSDLTRARRRAVKSVTDGAPGSRYHRDVKALWNGTVIAESSVTHLVGGVHYFPASSVRSDCFGPSGPETPRPPASRAPHDVVVGDGEEATIGFAEPVEVLP